MLATQDNYYANNGHYIEIECYECGVTDFGGKLFEIVSSGYTADNSSYIEVTNSDNIDFSTYTIILTTMPP